MYDIKQELIKNEDIKTHYLIKLIKKEKSEEDLTKKMLALSEAVEFFQKNFTANIFNKMEEEDGRKKT